MAVGDEPIDIDLVKPEYRFKGLDELMEMKYGDGNESGGNMSLKRASIYAFLFGIVLFLVAPVLLWASPTIVGGVRDLVGLTRIYFATTAFLNFSTGGLTYLVGYQAWIAAVILWGLSRRR